jgi:hypothetical protein
VRDVGDEPRSSVIDDPNDLRLRRERPGRQSFHLDTRREVRVRGRSGIDLHRCCVIGFGRMRGPGRFVFLSEQDLGRRLDGDVPTDVQARVRHG